MTLHVSTGFTSRILGATAFENIFNGGAIAVYSGAQPADANAAPTGTLLGYISDSGGAWLPSSATNGLSWVRAGQYVGKNPAQAWQITPIANGTAGWFRVLAVGDSGVASVSDARIDGTIDTVFTSGASLRFPSLDLAIGEVKTIDQLFYTIPPLIGL